MNKYTFQLTLINQDISFYINPTYFSQSINDDFQSLEKKFKEIHDFVEDMDKPKDSEFISEKIIEIKSDIDSLISMILPEIGYSNYSLDENRVKYYNDYYNTNNNSTLVLVKEKYIKSTEILTLIIYLIKENFGLLNTRKKMLSLANKIFEHIYLGYIRDENDIKYNLNLYNWLNYYNLIPKEYSREEDKSSLPENLKRFYENNQRKIYYSILNIGFECGINSNKNHEIFLIIRNKSIEDWLKFEDELQECQKIVESHTNNTTKLLQNK